MRNLECVFVNSWSPLTVKTGYIERTFYYLYMVLCSRTHQYYVLAKHIRHLIIMIIIIIIIIINCNWVVTRWQWLFYMYTDMKKSN